MQLSIKQRDILQKFCNKAAYAEDGGLFDDDGAFKDDSNVENV